MFKANLRKNMEATHRRGPEGRFPTLKKLQAYLQNKLSMSGTKVWYCSI